MSKVWPLDLARMARSLRRVHAGCRGVVVIVDYPDGISIGVDGLEPKQTVEALALGIHMAFSHDETLGLAGDEPPPDVA